MTGLNFVGHNVTQLNDTTNDAVDQNKSTLNLTTNGHQFGKLKNYYDSNFLICSILICTLYINPYNMLYLKK